MPDARPTPDDSAPPRSRRPRNGHATRTARERAHTPGLTYASAGVNLEAKDTFTDSLVGMMRRTHGARVLDRPGGFAGLLRLDYNEALFKHNYKDPVLVACCDGVGTKLKLAVELGKHDPRYYEPVGVDLVGMNVNDLVVEGAEPLLFLDYIAVHRVDSAVLQRVVSGICEGCKRAGAALIGGETAEMTDMYAPGDLDLAGFCVGVVELARATDSTRVEPGDVVLGLGSDGVHSNGYTLVRSIVKHAGLDLHARVPELAGSPGLEWWGYEPAPAPAAAPRRTKKSAAAEAATPEGPILGEVLLTPTRIYAQSIVRLLRAYRVKKIVTGMAHITGSGLVGNLERALHPGVDAVIKRGSWPVPPVFPYLQRHGNVSDEEMERVFNMGLGFCLIVRPTFAESVAERLEKLGERVHVVGKVMKGKGQVRYK